MDFDLSADFFLGLHHFLFIPADATTADLTALAHAMRCPLTERAYRPRCIHGRGTTTA
jgi:hypothetical protein